MKWCADLHCRNLQSIDKPENYKDVKSSEQIAGVSTYKAWYSGSYIFVFHVHESVRFLSGVIEN